MNDVYNMLLFLEDDDIDTDDKDDDDKDTGDDVYNDITPESDDDSDNGSGDYNALIIVDGDDDSDDMGGDDDLYSKSAKAAYAYICIANNMKHIHLNICGRKFQEIHSMCDDYYEHFSKFADAFYKLAAESPMTTLVNPTMAKDQCPDIQVESSSSYSFTSALTKINANIETAIRYISELRTASDSRPDVQSMVDYEANYLYKESRYSIRKRMTDPVVSEEEEIENESYIYNSLF